MVASYGPHFGEEPPLVGKGGSGTIFFSHCNLRCVYCQNHQISQPVRPAKDQVISIERLAEIMTDLQTQDCENINLVSPTHFIPQILKAIGIAANEGLQLPIVYNTGGYEKPEILRYLDGIIDIYMPDFKYVDDQMAQKYSQAPHYFDFAWNSLLEMTRQVGDFQVDKHGKAIRGVILRHLVLPGGIAGSKELFPKLAEALEHRVFLSLMAQYYPSHKAGSYKELDRPLKPEEYQEVIDLIMDLDFDEGWIQDVKTAPHFYRPNFDLEDPFRN